MIMMMIVININDNDDGYNYGDTPLPCSTEKEVNHLPLSHTAKDPASVLPIWSSAQKQTLHFSFEKGASFLRFH